MYTCMPFGTFSPFLAASFLKATDIPVFLLSGLELGCCWTASSPSLKLPRSLFGSHKELICLAPSMTLAQLT